LLQNISGRSACSTGLIVSSINVQLHIGHSPIECCVRRSVLI